MAKHKVVNVAFPVGGVDRSTAYQTQRPFTTPRALNVRPDSASKRERGGSRPGMATLREPPIEGGGPVRLLADVHRIASSSIVNSGLWSDDFVRDGGDRPNLFPGWINAFRTLQPSIVAARATILDGGRIGYALVEEVAEEPSRDSGTQLSILIVPAPDPERNPYAFNQVWYLFDNFDGGKPPDYFATQNPYYIPGIVLRAQHRVISETRYKIRFDVYVVPPSGGTRIVFPNVEFEATDLPRINHYLHMRLEPDNDGVRILAEFTESPTLDENTAQFNRLWPGDRERLLHADRRIGFGLDWAREAEYRPRVESFHYQYTNTGDEIPPAPRSILAMSSTRRLFAENDENVLEEVPITTPPEYEDYGPWNWFLPNRYMHAESRTSDLFIMHPAEPPLIQFPVLVDVNDSRDHTLAIIPRDGGSFPFVAQAEPGGDVCLLEYVEIGAEGAGVAATTHRLVALRDNQTRLIADGRLLSDPTQYEEYVLSIYKGAKVYHTVNGDYELWQTTRNFIPGEEGEPPILNSVKGTVPFDCTLVARYRDRMVLAGSYRFPHLWYMSRQGDPYDFDYFPLGGDADTGRAIAGDSSEAGEIGEPIKAIIPFSDDYMLFGCRHSLWRLVGDPAIGGQMDNISRIIGVVSGSAWCWGPEGQLFWLSGDGLYTMAPGAASFPQSVSRERIPGDLIDIDPAEYNVLMGYDSLHRGFHIIMDRVGQGPPTQAGWWFDWEAKSFWQQQFASIRQPTYLHYSRADRVAHAGLIIGCRDARIRKFGDHYGDSGSSYDTVLVLGPLRLGRHMNEEGVVDEIHAALGEGSDLVHWWLFTGDSAEEAFEKTGDVQLASYSGEWSSGGIQHTHRPRSRGQSAYLMLVGGQQSPWSIEWINMKLHNAGMRRLL